MNTRASFHKYITDDKHSLRKILAWLIPIYLEKLFIYYIEKYLFDVVFQSAVKCVNTVSSTGYQQFHTFFLLAVYLSAIISSTITKPNQSHFI